MPPEPVVNDGTSTIRAEHLTENMRIILGEHEFIDVRYVFRQSDMVSTLGTRNKFGSVSESFRDWFNKTPVEVILLSGSDEVYAPSRSTGG